VVSVWFDGINELNTVAADLGRIGFSATGRVMRVVQKTAFDIESTAKQLAPVRTGNLRNSITTTMMPAGLEATIGPEASYAAFVEWGTSRMAPHAFMGPALDRHSGDFLTALTIAAAPPL
jgi:HK97 gp10 family phage protein